MLVDWIGNRYKSN